MTYDLRPMTCFYATVAGGIIELRAGLAGSDWRRSRSARNGPPAGRRGRHPSGCAGKSRRPRWCCPAARSDREWSRVGHKRGREGHDAAFQRRGIGDRVPALADPGDPQCPLDAGGDAPAVDRGWHGQMIRLARVRLLEDGQDALGYVVDADEILGRVAYGQAGARPGRALRSWSSVRRSLSAGPCTP